MAAGRLAQVPRWGRPLAVGFLGVVQDMTIDPSAVFDRHLFDGAMSGQWNWVLHYQPGFFHIPFSNFAGWFLFNACWLYAVQLFMLLRRRRPRVWVLYALPVLAPAVGIVLIFAGQSLVSGTPFVSTDTHIQWLEASLLGIDMAAGLAMLLMGRRPHPTLATRHAWPVYGVPVVLHCYDVVLACVINLSYVYIPVLTITVIHLAYLAWIRVRAGRTTGEAQQPREDAA